jgi:hypothetical protein
MRDGQPALVSRQKSSVVLVRPASRQLQANGRPVFVVGINNFGKQPVAGSRRSRPSSMLAPPITGCRL